MSLVIDFLNEDFTRNKLTKISSSQWIFECRCWRRRRSIIQRPCGAQMHWSLLSWLEYLPIDTLDFGIGMEPFRRRWFETFSRAGPLVKWSSFTRGRLFESRPRILGGFFTFNCYTMVLVFENTEYKGKRGRKCPYGRLSNHQSACNIIIIVCTYALCTHSS